METTAEPTSRRPELARRRALGLALGAGASVALAGAAPLAAGAPAGAEEGRAPGYLATSARVTAASASGSLVDASALDPSDEPAEPWIDVPVAGFPWGLQPRQGDHVAISNGVPEIALAAVPLCSWVDGVPTPSGTGYAVGGRYTVPAAQILGDPANALATARAQGKVVSVCLADTDRGDALVLQVRQPGTPPAGSTGA